MIGLIQRVARAEVTVAGTSVAKIGRGLLALVAVERGDTELEARRLAERLTSYRVFADANERMNLSVGEIGGGLLLVPQFTLAADTNKGTRPGFDPAAPPEQGRKLFALLVELVKSRHAIVACGSFGDTMQVALVNDGPATFILRAAPPLPRAGCHGDS